MAEFVNIFDTIHCNAQCNGESLADTNCINLTTFLVLKNYTFVFLCFGENMDNIHFKAVPIGLQRKLYFLQQPRLAD